MKIKPIEMVEFNDSSQIIDDIIYHTETITDDVVEQAAATEVVAIREIDDQLIEALQDILDEN